MDEVRPTDTDGYTTFVAPLPEAVAAALEALLGAEVEAWEDRARYVDDDPLAALVRLAGVPPLALELGTPAPDRRAYFTGERLTMSYRVPRGAPDPGSQPGGRERLEALRARVAEADRDGRLVDALRDALDNQRQFAPISDWMYRQAGPQEALIRLGFRCNQNCWFCWQGRDWPEPPADLYHRWLDEFAAEGYTQVTFSGGEPTLHRELPALVQRASELGMAAWLQSNAIQLSKPAVLERLVDAGVKGLFVSYHSPDAETSDRMTRAPNTHGRTRAGIAAALAAGLVVQLNCVVERENYRQLGAHAQDVLASFVDPFPDNPVQLVAYSHPCEYYDPSIWERSVVPLDEVRPHLVAALNALNARGVTVEGIGTCGFPPCLLQGEPDLLRWLVPEDQHAMDVAGRLYAPQCDDCAAQHRCLGLRREYLDIVGPRGVRPFPR